MSTDGPCPATIAEGLSLIREGPVLWITLERPEQRNAVTQEMLAALIDGLEEATRDDDLRAIAIRAEGHHFCAGMDLAASNPGVRSKASDPDAAASPKPRITARHRSVDLGPHRLIELILAVEVPVLALVRGHAAGLGCALALAADLAVVSDTTRFVAPYIRRGFTPDCGLSYLLPRLVGLARAREMLLLGRTVEADVAETWGMITRVTPEAEADKRFAVAVAEAAGGPTVAIGLTKWLLNQESLEGMQSALRRESLVVDVSLRTKDFKEGVAAFLRKRTPEFEGR